MPITTLSSREFNQDTSRAKKAAAEGPVFITDRGKPAHVLLSIDDYRRLAGQRRNIADLLAMPGLADVELDIPHRTERAKSGRPVLMLLLDTNVVSELRKVRLGNADPNVARWSETLDTADLFISAVTIHELAIGVLLAERRDPPQGAVFRQWLERQVTIRIRGPYSARGRRRRQTRRATARS